MGSDSPVDLRSLVNSFWKARIIIAGVELGIYDCLDESPKSAKATAEALDCDVRAMEILLRALGGLGLLRLDDGKFSLNPAYSSRLVRGGEHSMTHILMHYGQMWEAWGDLDKVARTGKPSAARRDAAPEARQRARIRAFIGAMAELTRESARIFAENLDLDGVERTLDIGGGPGIYAIALARRKPTLRAVIFDMPLPLEIARENIAAAGLEDRVETRAGDAFNDDLGAGYDFIFISQLLHSNGPEENTALIAKAARALNPGGRLAVNEFALQGDGLAPEHAAVFGVNMLVNTETGRTFHVDEIKAMLEKAGLGGIHVEEWLEQSTLVFGKNA